MQQLGVFAKYWEPGKVKTRLAAATGEQQASRIYRAFVETLVARLSDLAQRRVLVFAPIERADNFAKMAKPGWAIEPQANGDLGARMKSYFDSAFSQGARSVVLLGSDSPDIPRNFIEQAFELLEHFPVVLGPSEDGGYYLIAACDKTPPVFDHIAWSTPAVWEETVTQLERAELRFGQLPTWYDVDEAESLNRLVEHLRRSQDLDRPLQKLKDCLCRELGIV